MSLAVVVRAPEIRVAVDSDVGAIAEIFAQATRYWTALDPDVFVEVDPERLARHYCAGKQFPPDVPAADRCTLVAEIDGAVVGFAYVTISRPDSEVDSHRPDVRGWVQEIAVAESLCGGGVSAPFSSPPPKPGHMVAAQSGSCSRPTPPTSRRCTFIRPGWATRPLAFA